MQVGSGPFNLPQESAALAQRCLLSTKGHTGLGQAPQAPQLCSPKGRHFFQCRSVNYPTCWGWPALPWPPAPLSGSPGPLELTRKAGFPLKGDFCSHCKLSCPAAAWVAPAHVTPAQGSWLCPPDVSRGDAASSVTHCSQSVGKRQVSNCCG